MFNPYKESKMKSSMKHAAAAAVSVFALAAGSAQAATVLVLLSDEAVLDLKGGKQFATGFYANELMQPVKKLIDAGHTLMAQLKITSADASPVVSLARVAQQGYEKYDAVFVPGGHAPMQDLVRSPQVGQLLAHFHANGKPTALVCHGPAALVAAMKQPGRFVAALEKGAAAKAEQWAYAGYKMTVLSNAEEDMAKGMSSSAK